MALDTRLPLMNVEPDAAGALTGGLGLGMKMAEARQLSQARSQKMNEAAKLAKQKDLVTAFTIASDFDPEAMADETMTDAVGVEFVQPTKTANYLKAVEALEGAGISVPEDAREYTPQNAMELKQMIDAGGKLYQSQMAAKAGQTRAKPSMFKQDELMRDKNNDLFNVTTYVDPNTKEMKNITAAIDGSNKQPDGQLFLTTEEIVTGDDTTKTLSDRAAAIAKSETLAEYSAKLENEPELAARIAAAKEFSKTEADEAIVLDRMEANMPTLLETVEELEALADIATYTGTGRAFNRIVKELGLPVPKGADARAEYIATVSNALLPLLRATFGAAFTEKEGDKLIATLGSPDSTPSQKKSELGAFVRNKEREIRTQKRLVESASNRAATSANPSANTGESPAKVDLSDEDLMDMY